MSLIEKVGMSASAAEYSGNRSIAMLSRFALTSTMILVLSVMVDAECLLAFRTGPDRMAWRFTILAIFHV